MQWWEHIGVATRRGLLLLLEPGEPRYREGASKRQHNTHVLGRILADFATTLVYKTTDSPLFSFTHVPGEPVTVRVPSVLL